MRSGFDAVIGMQFGDEGKGKIVDYLASRYDFIVRAQGGDNAGHTVVIKGDEFKLHALPSSILRTDKTSIIAGGVLVNMEQVSKEIDDLTDRGIRMGLLYISELAHVIIPTYRIIDKIQDASRKIGTTGRGIGPAMVAKVDRIGIRLCDFRNTDAVVKKIRDHYVKCGSILNGSEFNSPDDLIHNLFNSYRRIKSYIYNTVDVLDQALRNGNSILLEGAQGSMLDLEHGTYPYVTSTYCGSAGLCLGAGLPPNRINKIYGVMKPYVTRSGLGPLPGEMNESEAKKIRDFAKEIGVTTGKPRRIGWLDLPSLRHAVKVNGITDIAVTKMDVTDLLDGWFISTEHIVDRNRFKIANPSNMDRASITSTEWRTNSKGIIKDHAGYRSFRDLPEHWQDLFSYIESGLGVSVRVASYGADRDKTVMRT